MKKYLRAVICLLYSFIKFSFIKLFHFNNFKFTLYNLVSPFTEIDIGRDAKLSVGKKIRLRSGSKIRVRKNAEMIMGDNTSLNHNCIFTAHEKITIGKNVQFGPNVLIYDHDHDFRKKNGLKNLEYKTEQVEIGDNVWIGANVIILKGVKIGNNCVVAAGTVVSSNRGVSYPDNTLIYQKKDTQIVNFKYLD